MQRCTGHNSTPDESCGDLIQEVQIKAEQTKVKQFASFVSKKLAKRG